MRKVWSENFEAMMAQRFQLKKKAQAHTHTHTQADK
jgi:hypothetical protein